MADTPEKKTLNDEEIVTSNDKRTSRRAAMNLVGAGAAVGAVALATGCGRRRVVRVTTVSSGITDADNGPCFTDPAGGGRGNSGITDADGGRCADAAGRGTGGGGGVVQVQTRTGITDADTGSYADPAGNGRGGQRVSGITDSDRGMCSDPGGNGRGYSGRTDSDGGRCADPAGRGRY